MRFEKLLDKLGPVLRAIAYKLDGKYTSFDHEDLYQEAVFYLWRKFKEGRLNGNTDSFILQGCYYFLKNHIRKVYKRMDQNSFSINTICSEDENCTLENLLPAYTKREILDSIETKILAEEIKKRLTHREREVFLLRLENLSTRKIGKKLGISHVMVLRINRKIRKKCNFLKAGWDA